MADIASLGFAVDTRKLKEANKELKKMPSAAQAVGRSAKGMSSSVSGAAQKVANDNKKASKSFTSMRIAAVAAFAAISVGLRSAISSIADFEKTIAGVSAVTGATGADLIELRDIAKQLGATTEFSATQAAEGLKFLGRAGFTAKEAISALPSVLDLATAASLGLGSAADILSNIMSAFGIAATDAASVSDVLAAVASKANTDVLQLGQAMKFVGPVAKTLGISMGDTAAAIGVLADAGIQGGIAGTGLKKIISSLISPVGKAAEAITNMGLKLEDVNPKTNSMSTVINRLAVAGLDAKSALDIFGLEGLSSVLALAGGRSKLTLLTATLKDVGGAAATMAATMRDTLGGDIDILFSSINGLVLAAGDSGLTGVLRGMTKGLSSAFSFLAINMETTAKLVKIAGAALLVAFGPSILSGIAFGFGSLASAGIAAIGGITAAVAANPFGALALGLIVVTTALFQFSDDIKRIFGVDIAGAVKSAANLVANSFVAAFEDIKFVWANFGDIIGGAATGGVNVAIRAIDAMVSAAIDGINFLIDKVNKLPGVDIASLGNVDAIKQLENKGAANLAGAIEKRNSLVKEILARDIFGNSVTIKTSGGKNPSAGGGLNADALTKVNDEIMRMNELQPQRTTNEHATAVEKLNRKLAHTDPLLNKIKDTSEKVGESIVSSFTNAIHAGDSFLDTLKNIAINIANIALQEAAASASSGIGGFISGALGSIFGGGGGGGDIVGAPLPTGIMSADGGGFTGNGPRSGGLDGKGGFNAILHPQETIIDHTKGRGGGDTFIIDARGADREGMAKLQAQIQSINGSIEKRAVAAVSSGNNRGGGQRRSIG